MLATVESGWLIGYIDNNLGFYSKLNAKYSNWCSVFVRNRADFSLTVGQFKGGFSCG